MICDAKNRPVAQPLGWAEMQDEERKFREAEDQRLLYVAVTRPEQELLVSRCLRVFKSKEAEYDTSRWSALSFVLDELSEVITLSST